MIHLGKHRQRLAGIASAQLALGKLAEAEPLFREALAISRSFKLQGPNVVIQLNNVAKIMETHGDLAGAEVLMREALAMKMRLVGHEHADVADLLYRLAYFLSEHGKLAEAEGMIREALALERKLLGTEHAAIVLSLSNLEITLDMPSNYAVAEMVTRLHVMRKDMPLPRRTEDPTVADSLPDIARLLARACPKSSFFRS